MVLGFILYETVDLAVNLHTMEEELYIIGGMPWITQK